jgi:uncharacterized damage-inducible protein DinB
LIALVNSVVHQISKPRTDHWPLTTVPVAGRAPSKDNSERSAAEFIFEKEQAMSCPETEHFINNWNRIHKQSARALAAAPDDKLDWRPAEGMFTLRELVRHIPEAESAIIHTVLAGTMQKGDLDLSSASVEEIVRAYKESHERLVAQVAKLTLEQLNEDIEAFGRKMHRIVLLQGMTEHEIHHRGQLYTYYRLVGVEPPKLY